MSSQNADLDLIRCTLAQISRLVDSIEAERQHNATQDTRLSEYDSRLSKIERTYETMTQRLDNYQVEIQKQQVQVDNFEESINFLEAEIPHLRYLVGRNEVLEAKVAYYEPD